MSPLRLSEPSWHLRSLLITIGSLILILLFCGYVLFQARLLLMGPQITVTDSLQLVHTERAVFIEGNAQNIVGLSLNGRKIYTDANGNFRELIVLEPGFSQNTIAAEDRYGRQKQVHRQFVYTEPSVESPLQTPEDLVVFYHPN